MVNYWKRQSLVDVLAVALATALVWLAPTYGAPVLFDVSVEGITAAARIWLAPSLTLLGMMSATTAFVFAVVDREEFLLLKKYNAEAQLWRIFSENMLWLGVAAVFCGVISFWNGRVPLVVAYASTFLVIMISVCVLKFVWIMRQIVSVRISQASTRKSAK